MRQSKRQNSKRGNDDDTSSINHTPQMSYSVTLDPNLYSINKKFEENPDLGLTDEQILCYHRWVHVGNGPVTNEPWYDCRDCGIRKEDYKKYLRTKKDTQKHDTEFDDDDIESFFAKYQGTIF